MEELERLLWDERSLFEYWVHIVPTADLPIHQASMRRFPTGGPLGQLKRRTCMTRLARGERVLPTATCCAS